MVLGEVTVHSLFINFVLEGGGRGGGEIDSLFHI